MMRNKTGSTIESPMHRHDSLGWLVAILGNSMAGALDQRLRNLDLKITMWPTLMMLWQEDGLTQTELSSRCYLAHYTMTRVLDSLEKKGIIERKVHPNSRRTHLVYLTPLGHSLKTKGLGLADQTNDEFLSVLTSAEQNTLLKLMNKLIDRKNI